MTESREPSSRGSPPDRPTPQTRIDVAPTVGIVLCGGASLRMGRDKATIGSPPWAHRVAAVLQAAGCSTVEFQGGLTALGTASWRQFPDIAPGGGPTPAIVQAATRHHGHRMVIAACDLPNVTSSAITALVGALTSGEASAAAYRVAGRANWSLVALDSTLVERFAAMNPLEAVGDSLRSMLGTETAMVDPADPIAVTDIDEPLSEAPPEQTTT